MYCHRIGADINWNGEKKMDEMRKDRELEVFFEFEKKNEVGFPRRRRRVIFWGRLLVAGIAVCLAVAILLGKGSGGSGLLAKLFGFAGNNGPDSVGGEQGVTEETAEEHTEECDTTVETEVGAGESVTEEESTESESTVEEESSAEDETDTDFSVDLSEAERGAGYIVNYSSRTYDIEGLLEMGFHAEYYPGSSAPMVLILHTHTSEGYADLDPDDPIGVLTSSVVAVGETLAAELNRAKIPTVHCTVIHDGNGDPYANAAETIEMMLKIYPTVEYVIDLHRMELTDAKGNIVKTCSAKQTAQVRLTVSTEGVLTRGALSLAMCLREELNDGGRRVCMPVVLTDSEYNAAGSLYYLKLDVGSLGNSSDEACAAAVLFAEAFAEIIVG